MDLTTGQHLPYYDTFLHVLFQQPFMAEFVF